MQLTPFFATADAPFGAAKNLPDWSRGGYVMCGDSLLWMSYLLLWYGEGWVDGIETDPPYGIEFLKDWDSFRNENKGGRHLVTQEAMGGYATEKQFQRGLPRFVNQGRDDMLAYMEFSYEWGALAYRLCKPGARLVSFSSTRTYHWMAVGLECAGWEIFDKGEWVYWCLSSDTEILTEDGWVQSNRATEGRRALAFDPGSGAFEWQAIEAINRSQYEGPMMALRSDDTDQLVTLNHRLVLDETGALPFIEGEAHLSDLLQGFRDVEVLAQEGKRTGLLQTMQWDQESPESRVPGETRPRSGYAGGESQDGGEDARLGQPRMEGRRYHVQEAWQLFRDKVREIAGMGEVNGPQGWVRGGAPADHGPDVRLPLGVPGGRPSREPQSPGQLARQSIALADKPGSQARGTRKPSDARCLLPTTAVEASLQDYSGEVWCISVPSGAFVARRNGKIFVTGNSGFTKSHDYGKAMRRRYELAWGLRGPRPKDPPLPVEKQGPMRLKFRQEVKFWQEKFAPATKGMAWDELLPVFFAYFDGRGHDLKPAHEPFCLAWKPSDEPHHRSGFWLNIDRCRIPYTSPPPKEGLADHMQEPSGEVEAQEIDVHYPHSSGERWENGRDWLTKAEAQGEKVTIGGHPAGRFPANIVIERDHLAPPPGEPPENQTSGFLEDSLYGQGDRGAVQAGYTHRMEDDYLAPPPGDAPGEMMSHDFSQHEGSMMTGETMTDANKNAHPYKPHEAGRFPTNVVLPSQVEIDHLAPPDDPLTAGKYPMPDLAKQGGMFGTLEAGSQEDYRLQAWERHPDGRFPPNLALPSMTGAEEDHLRPPAEEPTPHHIEDFSAHSGSMMTKENRGDPEYLGIREAHPLGRFPANLLLSGQLVLGEKIAIPIDADLLMELGVSYLDLFMADLWDDSRGRYPINLYRCPKPHKGEHGEWNRHVTIKPEGLMRWIAQLLFNPAQHGAPANIIMDPFCGSGPTCKVAEELGLRWIGIDLAPESCGWTTARVRRYIKGLAVLPADTQSRFDDFKKKPRKAKPAKEPSPAPTPPPPPESVIPTTLPLFGSVKVDGAIA